MRRELDAILTAHEMDPVRRELYVEGPSDQIFVKWIAGNSINPNAQVLTIDFVDMPNNAQGGARTRLIAFAKSVEGYQAQIKCFADADTDRLHKVSTPTNVWLTDLRDMEGYLFREDCIDKLLKLGLGEEVISAHQLLHTIFRFGRTLGLLRLVSDEEKLNLPFQGTDMRRSLSCSRERLDLDLNLDRYITTLLQNAGLNQRLSKQIKAKIEEKRVLLHEVPDHELVHGKDTLCLLKKTLHAHGVHQDDAVRILRTCFERNLVEEYPSLKNAIEYITM